LAGNFLIETESLTKRFGVRMAVEGLNLLVQEGEVLGFLGPNGAGKTTTTRMLAGMIAPSAGQARVCGLDPAKEPERLHERIGLLTESPGFYEWMSARDNLLFFARFYPGPAQERTDRALRSIGLWERRSDRVGSFSKGMKQRLAMARALLHEPPLLFLDEPTAGLDPEAAHDVRDMIRSLQREGRTFFLCTHNLEEAEELCDRIALFKTRLIALDTPVALRDRLFKRTLRVDLASANPNLLEVVLRLPSVQDAKMEGKRLELRLTDFESDRPALVAALVEAGGRIESVFEETHSLEEVYLALLRGEPDRQETASSGRKVGKR
jgi:ABC-2 type transport system ATP-binding protein